MRSAEAHPTMRSTTTLPVRFTARARGLALIATLALSACSTTPTPPAATPLAADGNIAHAVYFDLKDPLDSEALVRECRERLTAIPGVRALEVGERCLDFKPPRNDDKFDVALWVVFDDRAAHDGYQLHPQHRALVEAWTPKLVGIKVYDAWVRR
jgi:hypothetical protein